MGVVLRSASMARSRRSRGRVAVLALLLLLATCLWALVVLLLWPWGGVAEQGPVRSGGARVNSSQIHLRWPNSSSFSLHLLQGIVFGIAGSSQLWPRRKEFIRLWWRPGEMRGFVWLDRPAPSWDETLPPVRVSDDTFTRSHGSPHPTGVRISRILLETFKLGLPGVQWFVLCDDDTVFSVANLVRVLAKYDPSELYYIGSISESHQQNVAFSYGMAFGGAGFAISYALAQALVGMQDECLQHYPELMGSDDRVHACISELGVPLTREAGFHQCDVRGNPTGLLAAHPVAPFVSLHHVEAMDPVFPDLNALQGLQVLSKSMQLEGGAFLQQSICYDRRRGLSVSVSSGYVVEVYPELVYPKTLERAELTFTAWNKRKHVREFDMNTRLPFWTCRQPFLFYVDEMRQTAEGVSSQFKRYTSLDKRNMLCWTRGSMPDRVHVLSRVLADGWFKAPRRRCCRVGDAWAEGTLTVEVGSCQPGETISP